MEDEHFVATVAFLLCDKPAQPPIPYNITAAVSPLHTELDILSKLGVNGRTYFSSFHEARESCAFGRPIYDLVRTWHPQQVEGCNFCIHIHARERKLTDVDLKSREEAWVDERNSILAPSSDSGRTGRKIKRSERAESVQQDRDTTVEEPSPPSVRFILSFAYQENPYMDSRVWAPIETTIEHSMRLDALPRLFEMEVNGAIGEDKRLRKVLRSNREMLEFTCYFDLDNQRDLYVDFDHGRMLLETVGDLLDDPSDPNQKVHAVLNIVIIDAQDAPANDGSLAVAAETSIAQIFRLGNVSKTLPPADGKLTMSEAIVAALDDATGLRLGAIPTWQVNNLWLGDCLSGGLALDYKPSYDWAPRYQRARSIFELNALVYANRNVPPSDPMEMLPTTPKYSLRLMESTDLHLGRDPKAPVQISLRVVNMWSDAPWLIVPPPKRIMLELKHTDGVKLLHGRIRAKLDEEKGLGRNAARLMKPEVMKKWEMWIWVLPQMANSAKLYRWTEGDTMQFLSPSGKDTRLYVEAHILPKKERKASRARSE